MSLAMRSQTNLPWKIAAAWWWHREKTAETARAADVEAPLSGRKRRKRMLRSGTYHS